MFISGDSAGSNPFFRASFAIFSSFAKVSFSVRWYTEVEDIVSNYVMACEVISVTLRAL